MSPRKLVGARDPYGFKPLCIGKRDNAYILASETCALDTIGAEYVRDVLPGETVTITPENGIVSDLSRALPKEQEARCIFEYIYFARPDSHIDGVSVYASRIKAGRFLAMDSPVEADLVVGVPESGNAAALGYSLQSGIPYGTAFVKNGYVGRTFIKPKQSSRESSVRVKLNVLKRGGGRQAHYHDRGLDCARNHIRPHCKNAAGRRSDRGACPHQLAAVFVAVLFWYGYSGAGTADRVQPYDRGDPGHHRSRFPRLSWN